MSKYSRVNDPSGMILVDRINNNFGYLSVDPPELTITSDAIDLDESSTISNVYSIDPAAASSIDTINGGVVGQTITIVNLSPAYTITILGSGGNIVGLTGSAILDGANSNITLKKIDTSNWIVISNSGNIILENVFGISYGNAKDGDAAVSDYIVGADYIMGGEYWFDAFEVDQDITVDASIGWLVIRANSLTVTKAGGATIDGQGKSPVVVGAAGSSQDGTITGLTITWGGEGGIGYMSGSGGTGGAGGDGGGFTGTNNYGGLGGKSQYDFATAKQSSASAGTSPNGNGSAGSDGEDFDAISFNQYIANGLISIGASSGGGGGSSDNSGGRTNGVAGVKGGAGIAIVAKTITCTTNLTLDTRGANGLNGNNQTFNGSGASGGGGGANNFVAYISKTGTITQTSTGGTGGTGGVGTHEQNGGAGGDGGDGLIIEIDDFAKTIDINGTGMLPV